MTGTDYWPEGLKKTKPREELAELLRNAKTPLTAEEIFDLLKEKDSKIWLSTVYRNLEAFLKKGLVLTGTDYKNTGRHTYEWNRHEHTHYAVCLKCHTNFPIPECPIHELEEELEEENFRILGHKLEIYGICKECSKGDEITHGKD